MKLNISLDWAVITSIFTIFLFWCGYWYFTGYASFYHYELDAFDLPLSTLLMNGLLIGVNYVLYLIVTLITLSFLMSVDKEHWFYFIARISTTLLNIYLLIFYLCKHFFCRTPKEEIDRTPNRFLTWLKPRARNTIRLDILLGLKVERFLKKHKISESDLKKSIYGDTPINLSKTIEFAMLVHYVLIILLTVGLLTIFSVGKKQSESGYKAAEVKFSKFSEMSHVVVIKDMEVNKDAKIDLRNTELCFKGLCLITDQKKNVQVYDMKDLKVLSKPDDDKKAP